MTEIKIEKKAPVWPWILIGLVIAALIYFFAFRETEDTIIPGEDDDDTRQEQTIGIRENNSTVEEYISFVRNSERDDMGLDHEFSNEALLLLADAIDAMADEVDVDLNNDFKGVRDNADHITDDPTSTDHANHIRTSALTLTSELGNIQREEYPELSNEITDLKAAANSIDPNVLTNDQRNSVMSYFDKAADVLEKMN